MDERAARAMLIKQSRRALIDALKLVYPGEVSFDSLRHVLPEIEEHHLRTDLAYLSDKTYVKWTNRRANQPWAERKFQLTCRGVEVADAINVDAALEP